MNGSTSSRRRRAAHRAVGRRGRAGAAGALLAAALVIATAVAGVLTGAGGSYALWNGGTVTDAGTVTAGVVKVSEQLALPAYTYRSGSTTTTGSVTVSNTGNVAAALTGKVTLGGESSAALAQAIDVVIWPMAADGCGTASVPLNPIFLGRLAWIVSDPSPVPGAGTLPPGASAIFCFRTSMNVQWAPGVPSGATVKMGFTVTLTAGDSWAQSTSVSTQQSFIDDIAPATPGPLSSAHTTFAAAVITWPATTDNVGVTGYSVYRDGVLFASLSPSAMSVSDGSVLAGSSYTYTLKARDAVGLVSTSAPLTVVVPKTDPTAWYRVANVKSGLCVSSQNTGSTDGTMLQQSACSSPVLTSQSWQFRGPNADGYYTVAPRNAPTLVWDISGGGLTDGTGALLWTSSGVTHQQWRAVPQGGGRFQYVARHSGKCLQVAGASTASGALLQQITCDSSDMSQVFQLTTVTPLAALVCTQQDATHVQYTWATPAAGDPETAGYAMLVNGQASNPATSATRDSPYAHYDATYNTAMTLGRMSIEIRQELVSGGEVWVGTRSAIVSTAGTDGTYATYTCG